LVWGVGFEKVVILTEKGTSLLKSTSFKPFCMKFGGGLREKIKVTNFIDFTYSLENTVHPNKFWVMPHAPIAPTFPQKTTV